MKKNPSHPGLDPDFVRFNPEFDLLRVGFAKNFGGLVLPARTSDLARQVWEYVLADPEAKAWRDGSPDPWGMKVNPVYATVASANSANAAFGDPVPDSFPKSDPYCYQGPPQGTDATVVPPPLCGTDWLPYAQSLRDSARLTRAGDDGARVVADPFALSADQVYKRDIPQTLGSRSILALTDSPSAFQYGLQMARLSRAGDNGAERKFIAPDTAGLTAGVASMAPKGEPAVLEPSPVAAAPAAYPLTALTYAAITPLSLDAKARQEYATFVEYAAGPGQVAGLELGQLPRGYAAMPASLQAQATAAAKTIREFKLAAEPAAPNPNTPTPTPPVPSPTSSAGSQSSSGSFPGGGSESSTTRQVSGPSGATETAAAPVAAPRTAAPTLPPAAKSLSRALTPIVALTHNRFAMPVLLGVALLSALGTVEINRRPRSIPGHARMPRHRGAGVGSISSAPGKGVIRRWWIRR